jgi:glycosyltransferase involved in cell wall biosynthesis
MRTNAWRVYHEDMKVGIDGYALGVQHDGTEAHVRNLIRAVSRVDPHGDYTVFVNPSLRPGSVPGLECMRRVEVRPPLGLARLPFASSLAAMRAHVDVMHVQFAAPLFCPARIVVTIHDIMFEHYPHFYSSVSLKQLRTRVPRTVLRAHTILTVSEFTKSDVIQRYRLPPERIVVAYPAPDPMFHPIPDQARLAAVRERYNSGEHFMLFVGALKPNKNVKTLVDAYIRLRRSGTVQHRLVLVGPGSMLDYDIFAPARDAGVASDLIATGFVPDEDLVALYNAADLFVQPSLFEGFGLPSLEAMACGTPVVTSTTSAIPEVVGDAALLVDPLDVEALAVAIARVLADPALRQDLSTRGLRRAAHFSWEATARTLVDVYRRAAERPTKNSGRLAIRP